MMYICVQFYCPQVAFCRWKRIFRGEKGDGEGQNLDVRYKVA